MLKQKRLALFLRITGWVLLCAALVLTICGLSTTGTMWNKMNDQLTDSHVSTDVGMRFRFSDGYFDLMQQLSGNSSLSTAEKKNAVAETFAWCNELAEKQELVFRQSQINAVYAFYEGGEFDAAAWMAAYEKTDEREEEKALTECFTYFDSAALNPPKKGKKSLKSSSGNRPAFETTYAALCEAQGEENIGSFLEFCQSVQRMLEAYVAENGTIVPSTYLESLDLDAYAQSLTEIRNQEKAEQAANLLDLFALTVQQELIGENADYRGFFTEACSKIRADAGATAVPDDSFLIPALSECLQSSSFYGDAADVVKAAESRKTSALAGSFSKTISLFQSEFVAEAELDYPAYTHVYWALARYHLLFWLGGILLLVSALILDKLRIRRQIANYHARECEMDEDVLLRVENLCQYFKGVKAVDDVSFDIRKGEVFGLVGESGCGKTTTGRSIIKLYDITGGNIYFKGKRIAAGTKAYEEQIAEDKKKLKGASGEERKKLKADIRRLKEEIASAHFDHQYCDRLHAHDLENDVDAKYLPLLEKANGEELLKLKKEYREEKRLARHQRYITQIQMIFQDSVAALDPRMTVREIIAEGLKIRGEKNKDLIDEKVYEVLDMVGLVREHAGRYPHEFSGGQKQRIGVARSVIMKPEMIIADEPVSALDVSIQAQVINLLDDLRQKLGLTLLFIAHDLSVVKYVSDRIGVMYYGKLVELADSDELFAHPLHPYTESLLSAIPLPDPVYEKNRVRIKYDPHTAHDYSTDQPSFREVCPGHFVRCNEAEFKQYRRKLGL